MQRRLKKDSAFTGLHDRPARRSCACWDASRPPLLLAFTTKALHIARLSTITAVVNDKNVENAKISYIVNLVI